MFLFRIVAAAAVDARSAATRMRRRAGRAAAVRVSALVCAFAFALAVTAADAPPALESGVVAGGGAHSSGARFAVEGTAGQPATARLAGTRFSVDGGFWQGAAVALPDPIFSNGFEDWP